MVCPELRQGITNTQLRGEFHTVTMIICVRYVDELTLATGTEVDDRTGSRQLLQTNKFNNRTHKTATE